MIKYGQIVMLSVHIDGKLKEVNKLEYCGKLGLNDWLHFVNLKTKENHLVKEDQFPRHTMVMDRGRTTIELTYQ